MSKHPLIDLSTFKRNKEIGRKICLYFHISFQSIGSSMSQHGKVSKEEDLGITEFLNKDNLGFSGVIKERFSDFNVYEIDKSMNVVHLGDQKFPDEGVVDQIIDYASLTDVQRALVSEVLYTRVQYDNVLRASPLYI